MTTDHDLDRLLDRWMDVGPTVVADRVVSAAMTDIHTTRQRGGRWLPWRIPYMTTQTIDRPRSILMPILAALLVLAGAIGTYLALRPDVGIGQPASRSYTEADVNAIVEAPAARVGELTPGEVSASYRFIIEGSRAEALHVTLDNSRITHSGDPADEELRAGLMGTIYTGLQAAETRFYDAVGPGGEPEPATSDSGTSFTVIAATYTDAEAAANAHAAYVSAYETWDFEATEAWSHGDASAAFAFSPLDRVHARCASLGATEPCPTALRVWQDGNLVVTVIQQGSGELMLDDMVATLEGAVGIR